MASQDQRIPSSSGLYLATRTYKPSGPSASPFPVIILAVGLGTVKENRTASFVSQFSGAGYASVTFDYRTWGESDGEPRHTVRPDDQYRDVCDVVAWVREQRGVYDSSRIVIWGSSFGGLAVTRLLAEDTGIAAGIMQCPCVDAAIASRMKPFSTTVQLGLWAILDTLGSLVGAKPIYVSCAKMDSSSGIALMEAHDVAAGYGRVVNSSHGPLKNKLTARSVMTFPLARPALQASKIVAPFLVVVPTFDTVAPLEAAKEVARKAKNAQLVEVQGGHFDVYDGGMGWDENIAAQLAFLKKHVPVNVARI